MAQERTLFDKEIEKIRTHLASKLTWLSHAYGRVERRKYERNETSPLLSSTGNYKTTYYYPALYVKDGEYLNLMPSDQLVDQCFFVLKDNQQVVSKGTSYTLRGNVSIIFWVNLKNIYGDEDYRYSENVKSEILFALGDMKRLEVQEISEGIEEVYDEYTTKDCIDFQMSPYYAVKFDCQLTVNQGCRETTQPVTTTGSFEEVSYEDSYERMKS